MAQHSVYTFFSVHNCLDEEFDAPDAAADHELCCAIAAGRMGLHPDVWGNHDPLATQPPCHRKPWVRPIGFPSDRPVEWKPHRPRPKPPPRPQWHPHTPSNQPVGDLQLTCDTCKRARFHRTLKYHGDRPVKVAAIRALGRTAGWTCIAGTDRCPACSKAAAPKPIGNGTGGDQSHEQHA